MPMSYANHKYSPRLVLANLTKTERDFYGQALKRFRANVPWADFEEFAFGVGSPIYSLRVSPDELSQRPLFEALKELWLRLGIRQGLISAAERHQLSARRARKRAD